MKVNFQFQNKVRIEMLPLIDIVFLLLVFFIYSMLSMAVHRGLPVALPQSSTALIDKSSEISVTVKSTGEVYVNRSPVNLSSLSKALTDEIENGFEPEVLLFADRILTYQRLFEVLDRIKLAGIHRISLQAELESRQ